MKANCAMAFEVLRTLQSLNVKPQYGITIV
jgi:hypothetical protein